MIQQVIELIQTQAHFDNHCLDDLERGLIPFATLKQAGFIHGLLRKCGVPNDWHLWLTGQLVGREIGSTKDLSLYEASSVINYLLVGSDGKGDSDSEPCQEAKQVIGDFVMLAIEHSTTKMLQRKEGGTRVEVVQQLGLC